SSPTSSSARSARPWTPSGCTSRVARVTSSDRPIRREHPGRAARLTPMVATTIHLLRHGEVHNPDGVLYGRLPGYPLPERGHAMARMGADHLAGVQDGSAATPGVRHDVVAVIASPL